MGSSVDPRAVEPAHVLPISTSCEQVAGDDAAFPVMAVAHRNTKRGRAGTAARLLKCIPPGAGARRRKRRQKG